MQSTLTRDRGSRKKLLVGAQQHYTGETNFDRIARAVCRAQCIPRKELYESWEMAKRVRRHLRGRRIVDLACGHGLLAYMLAVIDPRAETVLAVDQKLPPSAERIAASIEEVYPALAARVTRRQAVIRDVELTADDVVVCAHGCGALTDIVLRRAIAVGANVAVLPCCSDHSRLDAGGLEGWLDADMAIDVMRAMHLRAHDYRVWTLTIPGDITPKNRLLLGRAPTS